MTTVTVTESGFIGVSISSSDNYSYVESLRSINYGREDREQRRKMKGDPNELRKKANNKSTRPKWLNKY